MILMRGIDITRAIGRLVPFNGPKYARAIPGPKTGSTFNTTLPMARVMSIPRIKIITHGAV